MSQSLTHAVALDLRKGDTLYNNLIEFTTDDGTVIPATATVAGKCTPDPYFGFSLPIRLGYGGGGVVTITGASTTLWRTVAEKEARPVRVRRTRALPVQAEVESVPPRRHRRVRAA